ncbi:MAG: hypothetical protein ACKPHM_07000 [Dolichospermum sp.]
MSKGVNAYLKTKGGDREQGIVKSQWSVVRGQWFVVRGQWSVVRGPWSVAKKQQLTNNN